MAALVGNLLRRLEEFPMHKVDPRIAAELQNIEKAFSILLSHVQDAEWELLNHLIMDLRYAEGNLLYGEWALPYADGTLLYADREDLQDAEWDLHEKKWRTSNARFDISKLQNSIMMHTWPRQVAAWAADVEEIVISYDFHLLNFNTGTLFSKFVYSCPFMSDSNNVVSKIRNYLSIHSWSIRTSRMIQVFCPIDQSSAEDCVLLLGKVSEVLASPDMAEMLQQLKRTISPQHQTVDNFLSNHDSRTKQIRRNLESEDLIGRAEEVKLVEGLLLAKAEEGPDIITISGEAGIGKTTVAEAVYEQVHKHFDCHAWVFVSRNDSTRRVMQNILKGVLKSISVMAPKNIDTLEKESMKKLMNIWLIGKKFLLILDDVPSWEIVQEVKDAIPRGSETTKILVTSRVEKYNFPLKNQCKLDPIYSSDLLHKHAGSSERGKEFLSTVESVDKNIVRLCRGLPLAIVTVGRMLSTKHAAEDWIKVHQMFLQGANFMSLCYADLSPELQSCFLYAASFPCHFEISCKKLKRLWIAEGFVHQDNNRTLEESAQLQLEELIHRNMIQGVKRNIDGKVKTCQILQRIREFALRRSEEDHFSVVLKNLKSTLLEKYHRAFYYDASYNGTSTSKFSRKNFSRLYSFLALEENPHQPLNLNDFKLLSVLELQGFCHELLPDAVGDLALLRYLGLRGSKIKKLPVSLKKLSRLQTLDTRDTFISDLPSDLEGLGMMRHLLLEGSFTDKVVNLRDGIIEAFKDLQTVAGLKMTEAIAKGLIHLRGIRKLSVGAVQGSHLVPLLEAIKKMEFLRSFTMKSSFDQDQSYALPLIPLYNLERLCIGGPMRNNFLDWFGKLYNLKSLYLWNSKLTKDPLWGLQNLPNIILLSLCNSYDGEDIVFGDSGFPKLKKLSILHCRNLRNWKKIPYGAMTKLETLNLGYCPRLVSLPEGLEKLTSLCSLQISNMSAQFMKDANELRSISNFSISIQGIKNSS
ncbi:putative inactive disease susceptibility protein LOV1 [Nicotiana tabacum]|uniref:Disease resistance protein RPM1-like n=1 Tax=Nicotiana tabacum TaxID=4097 RepID=A0A1S3XDQ9_TOBAC|nr:disease resistance protein RPM1-like [Nicotiana tomentosiformis]XP_016437974.1 PREDICTED: disease resistance protein RPM1-like [Nicotiana tabacum]